MADKKEEPSVSLTKIAIIIIIVAFVLFSLAAAPTSNIGILSSFRGLLSNIFDAKWFFTLRTIAGILVFGLTAFSFWLFLRIREMELEHAEHVYPHEEEIDNTHKFRPSIESHIEKSAIDELMSSSRVKTAPPPQAIMDHAPHGKVVDEDKVDPYIPKELNLPGRKEGESSIRGREVGEEHPGQYQWQTVLKYISSPNPSDWKIAVIQADTILDEMTYMSGIGGDTIGERLKNADPGLFRTLNYAREAHGIRNQIAHNGFEFELSDRDARRAIKLYEEVFKEFKYI